MNIELEKLIEQEKQQETNISVAKMKIASVWEQSAKAIEAFYGEIEIYRYRRLEIREKIAKLKGEQ